MEAWRGQEVGQTCIRLSRITFKQDKEQDKIFDKSRRGGGGGGVLPLSTNTCCLQVILKHAHTRQPTAHIKNQQFFS